MSRRPFAVLAAAALASGLVGCTAGIQDPTPGSTDFPSALATDEPTTVTRDLDVPWSVAFHDGVALVSERDSARILEIAADGAIREVGVIDEVEARGEGGLLGIAVHDDHLYAYFTAGEENRIDRHPLIGSGGSLGLGPPEEVVSGMDAAGNHNGGRIAFGPDGMLYATVGDAGDPPSAQDLDSSSGKILRLTPDGDVPDDNPFAGSPVYSYGHRNPQGIGWDDDGVMYASGFGQDTWDELNVIEAGGNYGWPEVEGIAEQEGFIDPVQQWNPADASPSGIAVAGGSVWIANLRGERLREVALDDLGSSNEHLVGEQGRLRDVVVAPDGALWVLTNNTDGRGRPAEGDDRILRFPLGG